MTTWFEEESNLREGVVDLLNQIFSDRYHSLAGYMLEAQPYVSESDAADLQNIRLIAQYDEQQAARLADIIESLEGIPQVVAPYPHDIAEFNYLALPYMKSALAKKLRDQAQKYEQSLNDLQKIPAAHQAVSDVCAALRSQAEKLS